MLHLGDGAQLFPGQHAQPVLFVLMDLDVMEVRLLQRSLQLHIAVDRHALDPLGPFLVLVRVAAGFVAEEKYPARLQHTEDLA